MAVKKGNNKTLKIVIIVAMVLILAVGAYFLVKEVQKSRLEKEKKIFQQGFSYGYASAAQEGISYGYINAMSQIINISDKCEPFPVTFENETRILFSMNCLKGMV